MISKCISSALVIGATTMLAAQSPARYDKTHEQTLAGTVKAVASYPSPDGAVGVHIDLRTADGLVDVRVGPAMFIGMENFWFFAEDPLVVTGARIGGADGPVYARTIQKGSSTVVLRTDDGTPRWPGADNGVDGCGVNHAPLQRTTFE
jgi:hypothetical protein